MKKIYNVIEFIEQYPMFSAIVACSLGTFLIGGLGPALIVAGILILLVKILQDF